MLHKIFLNPSYYTSLLPKKNEALCLMSYSFLCFISSSFYTMVSWHLNILFLLCCRLEFVEKKLPVMFMQWKNLRSQRCFVEARFTILTLTHTWCDLNSRKLCDSVIDIIFYMVKCNELPLYRNMPPTQRLRLFNPELSHSYTLFPVFYYIYMLSADIT